MPSPIFGEVIAYDPFARRPERSEAKSRDLLSTKGRLIVERRSLRCALRAPVETTGMAYAIALPEDGGGDEN